MQIYNTTAKRTQRLDQKEIVLDHNHAQKSWKPWSDYYSLVKQSIIDCQFSVNFIEINFRVRQRIFWRNFLH